MAVRVPIAMPNPASAIPRQAWIAEGGKGVEGGRLHENVPDFVEQFWRNYFVGIQIQNPFAGGFGGDDHVPLRGL